MTNPARSESQRIKMLLIEYTARMARRGLDRDILGKMGLGVLMILGAAAYVLILSRISPLVLALAFGGVLVFLWGLLSIGDKKSDWE